MILRTPITDEDLAHFERLALAASQEDLQVGHTDTATHEEAIAFVAGSIGQSDATDKELRRWRSTFNGGRRHA